MFSHFNYCFVLEQIYIFYLVTSWFYTKTLNNTTQDSRDNICEFCDSTENFVFLSCKR